MAVTTVLADFAALTELRLTSSTNLRSVTTTGTIVIDTDDFSQLVFMALSTSTTAAVTLTLSANTNYSDAGLGSETITLATANASIAGLTASATIFSPVDSTRFKSSSGTLIINVPALPANTLYVGSFKTKEGRTS
jgi:hypothetical protein